MIEEDLEGKKVSYEYLERLETKIILNDLKVMNNPKKYLDYMITNCVHLLKVLDKIEYALSPSAVFDFSEKNDIRVEDVSGEALIRCNAALEVIRKYKK